MSQDVPELLHFRVSHYNEKVRWALDHKRWPHRRRALVPGFHLLRARSRLPGHFAHLESEIGPGGYLVGDCFTIADLAAAAVMTAIVRPPQFPYPLPQPWPPELVHLRDSVAGRAGFKWVLDIYARHRDASAEIA